MSVVRTKTELINATLENLGALAVGQSAQVEDSQRVTAIAPSIIATLAATEVYYLNDIDNIPDEVLVPLAAVIAWGCRTKFGINDPQELATMKEAAEAGTASLKIMTRSRATYAPLKTEYF